MSIVIESNPAVILFVVALDFLRRPFNISRFVTTIIFNAVNRVLPAGALPYMNEKCLEVVYPQGGDGDSAPSVVGKRNMIRVSASVFHCSPYSIFRCFTFTMRKISECSRLVAKAPTAFGMPASKSESARHSCSSTDTTAFPLGTSILSVFHSVDNCETPKSLSCKINEFLHDAASWLKVMVEDLRWQAGNQVPLFRSYLSQRENGNILFNGCQG
jgi:hypothetical protein